MEQAFSDLHYNRKLLVLYLDTRCSPFFVLVIGSSRPQDSVTICKSSFSIVTPERNHGSK